MGVLIAILVVCGLVLLVPIILAGAIAVASVQEACEQKKKFELEFYKRCQSAGLGNVVKTKSEIQKAAEIAQKMVSEKEFQRKLKKYHLKARWLNERLNNGGMLFAQKARAEEQKKEFEAEKTRMFEALPHGPWSFGYSEYTLEKDRIVERDEEIEEPETYLICYLKSVEVEVKFSLECCYYLISFRDIGSGSGTIWLDEKSVTPEQVLAIYKYLVKYSQIPTEDKGKLLSEPIDLVGQRKEARKREILRERDSRLHNLSDSYSNSCPNSNWDSSSSYGNEGKDASVVGRAVAGTIIAGPVGGVIGALSAVDKNNKNRGK